MGAAHWCYLNVSGTYPHPISANKLLVFMDLHSRLRSKFLKTLQLFADPCCERTYGLFSHRQAGSRLLVFTPI
ncbi:MAG: hypothetical protein ACRD27_00025, partial [Terracidiphilus sp.]